MTSPPSEPRRGVAGPRTCGYSPARARSGVLNIQIRAQNAGSRGSEALTRVPAVRGDGNQSRADLRVSSSFPAGAGGRRRESHMVWGQHCFQAGQQCRVRRHATFMERKSLVHVLNKDISCKRSKLKECF